MMDGDVEKNVATKIIQKYLRKGNMAMCMRDVLPHSGLAQEQRDAVAKLVHNVVRWKRWYDYVLGLYMVEKTPDAYVEMAIGKHVDQEKKAEKMARKEMNETEYLATRFSFSTYAAETIKRVNREWLTYLNSEPETHLCVDLSRTSAEQVIDALKKEDLSATQHPQIQSCVITQPGARYSTPVEKGFAIVQDVSSQTIAHLVADLLVGNTKKNGEGRDCEEEENVGRKKMLDYCAGSGGKTIATSFVLKKKFQGIGGEKTGRIDLHAYDINRRKLLALKKRAEQTKTDVHVHMEKPEDTYNLVLVDAPCSDLGAARRNPEAKYVKKEDVERLVDVQKEILGEAEKRVRRGGYLVYCVCTVTPEETDHMVSWVEKQGWGLTVVEPGWGVDGVLTRWPRGKGYRTTPAGGDILFVSVMRKDGQKGGDQKKSGE